MTYIAGESTWHGAEGAEAEQRDGCRSKFHVVLCRVDVVHFGANSVL